MHELTRIAVNIARRIANQQAARNDHSDDVINLYSLI